MNKQPYDQAAELRRLFGESKAEKEAASRLFQEKDFIRGFNEVYKQRIEFELGRQDTPEETEYDRENH